MFSIISLRAGLFALWLLAAGGGIVVISNYQNRQGPVGSTPEQWPAVRQISLNHDHDTLLMFAHPQCPCTRASVEELNRLLAQVHDQVTARVLFFEPGKYSPAWAKTDLWRSASAIPGVTVLEDIDGLQANLFGAETSGCVLLFDTHGRLLFKGGITGSRGHAGDNAAE